MSFSEEWKQLPGRTKMFIIGGGGVAVFFLYTAIKNRKAASTTSTTSQDTSAGPQTAAFDPTSWIDSQNQQMQAMQDLIQQNQLATQQQIQALNNSMATPPTVNIPDAPPSPPTPSGGTLTTGTFQTVDQANKVMSYIQQHWGNAVRIVGNPGAYRVQADMPTVQGATNLENSLKQAKLISIGYASPNKVGV